MAPIAHGGGSPFICVSSSSPIHHQQQQQPWMRMEEQALPHHHQQQQVFWNDLEEHQQQAAALQKQLMDLPQRSGSAGGGSYLNDLMTHSAHGSLPQSPLHHSHHSSQPLHQHQLQQHQAALLQQQQHKQHQQQQLEQQLQQRMRISMNVGGGGGGGGGGGSSISGSSGSGSGVMSSSMGGGMEETLGMVRGLIGTYSLKRCQGFVRCDMDIDAEVVGWVIGKNGSTIKDMKHKTGCNMWVDQRALKLTITGPDVRTVENAAKSVEAYVSAAPIKAGAVEAAVTRTLDCPPHLLDVLGDRAAIARVVKETRAQVVVNKKMMRVIVRGNPHAVELACGKVQRSIHAAMAQHARQQLEEQEGLSRLGGVAGGPVGIGPMGGAFSYSMSPPLPPAVSSTDLGYLSSGSGSGPIRYMGGGGGIGVAGVPAHMYMSSRDRICSFDTAHSDVDSDTDADSIAYDSIGSGAPGGGRTSSTHSPVSSLPHSPSAAIAALKMRDGGGDLEGTGSGTWSLFSSPFNGGVTAAQDDKTTTCSPCSTPATSVPATPVPSPQLTSSLPFYGAPLPPPMYLETVSEESTRDGSSGASSRARRESSSGSTSGSVTGRADSPPLMMGNFEGSLIDLLTDLSLDKYGGVFEENEIDIDALALMGENDLKELSIPKGPRLKIMNALRNHRRAA